MIDFFNYDNELISHFLYFWFKEQQLIKGLFTANRVFTIINPLVITVKICNKISFIEK